MKSTSEFEFEPINTSLSYSEALVGVLVAIGFGYGILFLLYFLDSTFNWGLMNFFSNLYILRVLPPNHLYVVSAIFAYIIDIPNSFGWFIGGLFLGIYFKKNKVYYNEVKGSWKAFQIALYSLMFSIIGSTIYFFITYLFNLSMSIVPLFFGSLILLLLIFFVTPGFWLSFTFVLLGGFIGARFVKPISKPPILKTVKSEKVEKITSKTSEESKVELSKKGKAEKVEFEIVTFDKSDGKIKTKTVKFDPRD